MNAQYDSEANQESGTNILSRVQDCSLVAIKDASTVQHGLNGIVSHEICHISITAFEHGIEQKRRGALVDRGANGTIIGKDARVLCKLQREVDVTGIDNHELNSL